MPLNQRGINMHASPRLQPPIGTPASAGLTVPTRPASRRPASNTLGAGIASPPQFGNSVIQFTPAAPGTAQHPVSRVNNALSSPGLAPLVRDYGAESFGPLHSDDARVERQLRAGGRALAGVLPGGPASAG